MAIYQDLGYYDYDDDYYNVNVSFYATTNATINDTDTDFCDTDESTIRLFQTVVFCVIFALGVTGNLLVILTFALYRRRRLRSMTDVFLFHLALADLLLLLTLPLQAADTHLGWVFSAALCRATRASYAVNTYSGILLLACVSVDRYLVVARAKEMLRLRHRILTGGKIAALAVWLAATLLSLPEILYSGVSRHGDSFFCGVVKRGSVKMATNGAIIAVFCVSIVVMVACYSLIARVLWLGHAPQRGKRWHRQRTLKLMVALVLVFLAFQLPYTVVLSRKMAGEFCGVLLEYVTCTLAFARCCLNPILYAMVGVRFRGDVAKLLHDCGCYRLNVLGSASFSLSSPASHTGQTPCSPPSYDHSSSGNRTGKFQFTENI